eukprot:Nitzschia sp. Nitz4//scaffold284_size24204//366//2431//NITZ4_008411-RA/size24204-augustus-gene-0.2-mRNA-1//1//CDS//3329545673//7085//frame0
MVGSLHDASSSFNNNSQRKPSSLLSKYFLVVLFVIASLYLFVNVQHVSNLQVDERSVLKAFLEDSFLEYSVDPDEPVHSLPVTLGSVNQHSNRIANLDCERFGGPSQEVAQEMVYWEDIPSDAEYVSPFHHTQNSKGRSRQFLTFEPDGGGWNNIRMAMETVLGMSFAMGRTLVLPPHQEMYLLNKRDNGQRKHFSFDHFFHMERIHEEHVGLDIISMEDFLKIVMTGKFVDPSTQQPMYPPGNRTDWNGANDREIRTLNRWLRNNITSTVMLWDPEECLAAFPRSADPKDMEELQQMHTDILAKTGKMPKYETFIGKPYPVDSGPAERYKENSAERTKICLYNKELQDAAWVHWPVERRGDMENRLLVHFYAFLFFQDWKTDLWMKRFMRDHVRYIDEIQCAAARVVEAIRQRVEARGQGRDFDTMHVRRGDFQYTVTRVEANDIYAMTSKKIPDNTTVYIATDERDKSFFKLLQEHYDVVFLDDFMSVLPDVNSNYYGMIDQIVASRGRIFFGCWFSTFTGYINRLRGYFADDYETEGYEEGIVPSYYYALKDRFLHMQEFYPVKKSFYAREFPAAWRLIDTGVEESNHR